ncbi:hypothetical protein P4131_03735 [Pseudomonas aeruginosa]|nr:hypothetical protein [Pseudomonas aeruginosa]
MPDSFNFASPPFDQLRPINARPSSRLSASATMRRGKPCWRPARRSPAVRPAQGRGRGRGDDGRVFAHHAADDLFDVRGLFSGSSKHRYLAIEESIVYELPASCFHQLCGENPGFARFFQADLAAKRQLAQRDGQNLAEFILPASPASTCCRRWRWRPRCPSATPRACN